MNTSSRQLTVTTMIEHINKDILEKLQLFSPRAVAGVEYALADIYEPLEKFISSRNWHGGYSGLVDFDGNPAPLSRRKLVEDADYLCVGCSFSVASGLPQHYSWPSILQELTGKLVNNIAQPGVGYSYLALAALDVIKNYGKPKTVYGLVPDPFRLWLRSPPVEVGSVEWSTRHLFYDNVRRAYVDPARQQKKLSPLYIDANGKKHVIEPSSVALHNMSMLRLMEVIIESLGIDFHFTTWTEHQVFNENNNFKSYIKAPNSFKTRYLGEATEDARGLMHERWRDYGVPIRDTEHQVSSIAAAAEQDTEEYDEVWDIPEVRHRVGQTILMCDHSPKTKHQEKFWAIGTDGMHPGLHDQIHFAEHILQQSIPGAFLKQLP